MLKGLWRLRLQNSLVLAVICCHFPAWSGTHHQFVVVPHQAIVILPAWTARDCPLLLWQCTAKLSLWQCTAKLSASLCWNKYFQRLPLGGTWTTKTSHVHMIESKQRKNGPRSCVGHLSFWTSLMYVKATTKCETDAASFPKRRSHHIGI